MSIIYNDLDNDFTLIPNIILQDTRISGLAFKMYSYIAFRLGRDKKWEFYNREIISHFKEGRDAVMKARNELLELGYLEVIKQNKASNGKYLGNDYIIRKNPKKPLTENQYTENPLTENQCSNNKDKKNKDLNKKDCNARQSNFSKNLEEESQKKDVKENNTPKTLQNGSNFREKITFEDFKQEWFLITTKEPSSFETQFVNFKRCFEKMGEVKKKFYVDWKGYLKQKWVSNTLGIEKPQADPLPLKTPAPIQKEDLDKIDNDKFKIKAKEVADFFYKEKVVEERDGWQEKKEKEMFNKVVRHFKKCLDDIEVIGYKNRIIYIKCHTTTKEQILLCDNRLKKTLKKAFDTYTGQTRALSDYSFI